MRLFGKLLLLLLALSILPLLAVSVAEFSSMKRSADDLASHIGKVMTSEVKESLRQNLDNYSRIIRRESQILESALQAQAEEAQRLLSERPPIEPRHIYLSSDYDRPETAPENLIRTQKYHREGADGKPEPIPGSLRETSVKLAPGVSREAVAMDLARLDPMISVYRGLLARYPDVIVYCFTALEDGFISIYPGLGGLPGDYDPRNRPWYVNAKKAGGLVWNEPYVDAAGMGVLANLSMPIFRPDGSFAGVTALDICNITSFTVRASPGHWASSSEIFLTVPEHGESPGKGRLKIIGRKGYRGVNLAWTRPLEAEYLSTGQPLLDHGLLTEIEERASGVLELPHKGVPALWAFTQPWENPTILLLIVPKDRILANAESTRAMVLDRTWALLERLGWIILGVILAALLVSYRFSRTFSSPINALASTAQKIAQGNLGTELPPIRSKDEIGDLYQSVEAMRKDLTLYINDLTEATAARERVESELKIARSIQMSFVPRKFPPFPDRSELDIHAYMEPARQVGGDLYDFFFMDETHLFFAVGDVSGKGVPAALFMAVTKSLMKGASLNVENPDQILALVNLELCRENETSMFVTLFCGILDTETGEVRFANAGHTPPVILSPGKPPAFMAPYRGLLAGVFETAEYRSESLVLGPGDAMVLYTDGVTEARNAAREFHGPERLARVLAETGPAQARRAVDAIVASVKDFCGDEPPFDDITVMVLRYVGKSGDKAG